MDFDSLPDDNSPVTGTPKFDDLPEDANQYETAGQQAKTFGEGVARGATLSGSDVLETSDVPQPGTLTHSIMGAVPGLLEAKQLMGKVSPQDIAGRMEANPVESIVGQLVGTGLGIAATGGASALTAAPAEMGVTTGLAKGAMTRLALATAARGVEGAAFGASNAVTDYALTDYALGDPNLNAQKVLSYVGWGSALNLAMGPLGKVAETVFPGGSELLDKAFNKLKDGTGAVIDRIPGDWGAKLRAGWEGILPQSAINRTTDNIQELIDAHIDANKKMYGMWQQEAPNLMRDLPFQPTMDAAQAVRGQLDTALSHMENNPDVYSPTKVKVVRGVISDLTAKLDMAETPAEIHDALWQARKSIDAGVNWADPAGIDAAKKTSEQLLNLRTGIGEALKNPEIWGEPAANQFANMDNAYNAGKQAIKDFQGKFSTMIQGKMRADPAKMKAFFNGITQDPNYNVRNEVFNNLFNAAQNAAKVGENYAGASNVQNSISARLTKVAQEHEELKSLAQALAKPKPGAPGIIRESMIGAGLKAMGASNPVVAGTVGALEAYRAIRNPYAVGKTMNSVFNTMGALSKITQRASKAVGSAISGITSGSGRGVVGAAISGAQGYDDRVEQIKRLQQNPQAMMNTLQKSTEAMYEAAPNISNGVHNALMNGVNFLASKIPQPVTQFPLSGDWEPTVAQKDQFNEYYDTVNSPLSVLDSVREGTLSNYQIEALQAVYPHLLSEMKTRMVQSLNPEKSKDMPYGTKYAIAKFLAQPLDGNMTQTALMSNQAAFMPSQQAQQPPQKGGKSPKNSTLGGLKELDVANRAETQTDELEKEEST